jgi:mono/diheme cytochrome c family protein
MRTLPLAALALIAAVGAVAATPRPSAAAKRGLEVAEARCAVCHAVRANQSSPNPESPSFEDVANRTGLSQASLAQYLRDAHNYPAAMDFTIERRQVRDLSAYFVSLRRPGYKPAI